MGRDRYPKQSLGVLHTRIKQVRDIVFTSQPLLIQTFLSRVF